MDKHRNADGTYDGAGVMGEVTGLGREAVAGLWEQVKANHAKLDACQNHEFEPIQVSGIQAARPPRQRCKHCGGEIDAIAFRWYWLGREHEKAARLLP